MDEHAQSVVKRIFGWPDDSYINKTQRIHTVDLND